MNKLHQPGIGHGTNVTKPELPESNKEPFTLTVEKSLNPSKAPETPVKIITVPKRLTRPHQLVKQACENINKKSLSRFYRVWSERPLDISVGPENIDRGLRILDTIIKEIENVGIQYILS